MGNAVLPFDGGLAFVSGANSGGTGSPPGGSTTQIQFNDAGAFGGDADLTWDKTGNVLGINGDIDLDDGGSFSLTLQTITPTVNRTISFPDASGTVALVGGTNGQVVYNAAGAQAGISTLTTDGTNLTLAGRLTNTFTSLADAPAKLLSGTWFTGGTASTTKPHFLIEPAGTTSTAWSTLGTGLGVNAASGFTGKLLDLQLNGAARLDVAANGKISFYNEMLAAFNATPDSQLIGIGRVSNRLQLCSTFGVIMRWGATEVCGTTSATNFRIAGSLSFAADSSVFGGTPANQVFVRADADNIFAQRNSTNAQTYRVYNTWTSSTNNELGKLEWSSNVFRIGTEKGSGGGVARSMEFQTDGITRATVGTNGVFSVTSLQETVFTIADGANVELNPANGNIQVWTLGADRTPAATSFANGQSMMTMIDDGAGYAITWTTAAVTWVGGTAPTLATTGYTVVEFWKVGSTLYGAHVGDVA